MAPSQRERVAAHLRTHGGLTEEQARRQGIGQLRTRVLELRRAGWEITTCTDCALCTVYPGRGHYLLEAAPDEAPRHPGLGL